MSEQLGPLDPSVRLSMQSLPISKVGTNKPITLHANYIPIEHGKDASSIEGPGLNYRVDQVIEHQSSESQRRLRGGNPEGTGNVLGEELSVLD